MFLDDSNTSFIRKNYETTSKVDPLRELRETVITVKNQLHEENGCLDLYYEVVNMQTIIH